jgi:hypothetical protein
VRENLLQPYSENQPSNPETNMNPEFSKLRHEQRTEAEQSHAQIQSQQSQAKANEFATVDELLRFDSDQNPVPPEVAERLNHSIAAEPKRERSWFKRLFRS